MWLLLLLLALLGLLAYMWFARRRKDKGSEHGGWHEEGTADSRFTRWIKGK